MAKSKGLIYISPVSDRKMAEERLAIIKQLVKLGYSVRVPIYGKARLNRIGTPEHYNTTMFVNDAKALGANPQKIKIDSPLAHDWIRDRMVHVGNKTIIGRAWGEAEEHGKKIPLVHNGNRIYSKGLGVGGEFVEIDKGVFLISKDSLRLYPGTDKQLRELSKREGIRFIPVKNTSYHLDLEVNSVPQARLVIANEEFLKANPHLKKLFKELGMNLIYTHPSEHHAAPANFLKIGPKRILITSDAPKTIERIRQNRVETLPSIVPPRHNLRESGGIRCFSQKSKELYRRVHGHK